MTLVEMYTTEWCPWCTRAKRLLHARGVASDDIEEILLDSDRTEMFERTGKLTVPQIFIAGRHVGGYDDLADLDRKGRLRDWLEADVAGD